MSDFIAGVEGKDEGFFLRPGYRAQDEGRPNGGEDHEERARRRMAALRSQYGDLEEEVDANYDLDKWYVEAPPGWSYEWKTLTVWNKEFPAYQNSLLRRGWEPVPAARHRDKVHPDYRGEVIIQEGLILMERPLELTIRAREREKRKSLDAVFRSEQKLVEAPEGTAPRDRHPRVAPRVSAHVGPVIPE